VEYFETGLTSEFLLQVVNEHRIDFDRGYAGGFRDEELSQRAPPGTYFHNMKVPGRDGRLDNPPKYRCANEKVLSQPPRHS
jgi:hypothetical protein